MCATVDRVSGLTYGAVRPLFAALPCRGACVHMCFGRAAAKAIAKASLASAAVPSGQRERQRAVVDATRWYNFGVEDRARLPYVAAACSAAADGEADVTREIGAGGGWPGGGAGKGGSQALGSTNGPFCVGCICICGLYVAYTFCTGVDCIYCTNYYWRFINCTSCLDCTDCARLRAPYEVLLFYQSCVLYVYRALLDHASA